MAAEESAGNKLFLTGNDEPCYFVKVVLAMILGGPECPAFMIDRKRLDRSEAVARE